MKKILVTGGVGFIGTNLCLRLLKEGHHVICVDNFCSGQKKNMEILSEYPSFQFIEHDIIHPLDMEVNEIYNLACPASPPRYQSDPIFTTKTSVLGALNMLELAKKNDCKILQASTSEVYGDPEIHPQVEEYRGRVNPIGVRSCYDEGKRCAESLFFDYARLYQVQIKVVRIFNTYGPYMDPEDGRVVSNFINQSLEGEALTIYGSGEQTRSFCYVDDLVEGLIKMMDSCSDIQGPINLGNPIENTMLELAQSVLAITSSSSELQFMPLPEDDPTRRKPNIDKAKDLLGWSPGTELKKGLGQTIRYFQSLKL